MALKVTTRDGTVIEGDTADVVAALRAIQAPPAPAPREYRDDKPFIGAPMMGVSVPDEASSRNPRGLNRRLALQALVAAGQDGSLQAHVQQWILRHKNIDLAISSVRHALAQLLDDGLAMRTGDIWRVSGNGVSELGRLEAAKQLAKDDLEDLIR